MARSPVIWLLIDRENSYAPVSPVAAFTVKHEMKTYLDQNRWQWGQLRLFRMKDGPHPRADFREQYQEPTVEEMNIREVMK